ncbi:WD40 repeat-like protein [Violaceomyces palustris]|uniref:WD40 repeat-like protein n=1 Tax=Violaceomyces palustris TaxID=1673888 RepID=A0ACD0P6J0_9BASI|nr:WD40 repeat-like protein [Violaceomyces palustris]
MNEDDIEEEVQFDEDEDEEDEEDDEDIFQETEQVLETLEQMAAAAEESNNRLAEDDADDYSEDPTYSPGSDGGAFLDLEEGMEDYEEEEEEEEEEDEEEEDAAIDIQELLRAHLNQIATEDSERGTTQTATLNSIGLSNLRRLLATGAFSIETVDDDDDDERDWYGIQRNQMMTDFWDPIEEPIRAGQELMFSGEFGKTPLRPLGAPPSAFSPSQNISDIIQDRKLARRRVPKAELASFVPNSNGVEVARYPARCYCGQYSEDSSFFYTCTQDFKVQMYDTTVAGSKKVKELDDGRSLPRRSLYYHSFGSKQYTSLKPIKTIQGRQGNWTITDANLSPDNQWMIYSSITPFVHLVPTREDIESGGRSNSDNQVMLDFSNSSDDDVGIWSIRFSGDSREIVAGAHFGDIYVYDIEARKRVLRVEGHADDVNGVAFADSASSNVLISGSDDSFVKVWDRRSLSGGKPAGVLTGHTEGITFVAPKGDGRYCISNGKDQSTKLWDLRQMHSSQKFATMAKTDYGLRNWDYRNMYYRQPRYQSHPEDCSVMTYRGHAVLKTLIRCHFSPMATTGQKYIYSGSADGKIHIWSLDGKVVQILDRAQSRSIYTDEDGSAADPSSAWPKPATQGVGGTRRSESHQATDAPARGGNRGDYTFSTVRDVSWHSSEPSIMSTAWDGQDGQRGSIAKHELANYNKTRGLSLEDAVEREYLESFG